MQSIDKLIQRTAGWSRQRFVDELRLPVLVATAVLGGRIKQRGGAALNASTMAHTETDRLPPVEVREEVLVTHPLRRPMWVSLGRGEDDLNRLITLGRSADCDVVINDYTVSSTHARVVIEPSCDGVRLIDVGSTNGTSVFGLALIPGQPMRVTSETSITVGRLVLLLLSAADLWAWLRARTEGLPAFDVSL